MQKTSLPLGVKNLKTQYEKGTLKFDNPVQRAGGQWNIMQKSMLIHSMLASYPIPSVYLLKENTDDGVVYDVLDAKQRLTSVFEFIDGEYPLHASTPEVELDGVIFDLANLTFEELSDECKDEILGYRFSISCIEGATEDEVEEIFARLNASTPLSPIQKTRSIMGTEMALWLRELCQSDFLTQSACMTIAQLRREADLEVMLQGMLLLDARHEGYEYTAISTKEVTKYSAYIRANYGADKKKMFEEIVGYLSDAFGGQRHKFLRKSNIPMIIVLAKVAIENGVTSDKFKGFVDVFNSYECPAYEENMGSGNVKKTKVQGRLRAIAEEFEDHFELKDTDILGVADDIDEVEADGSED